MIDNNLKISPKLQGAASDVELKLEPDDGFKSVEESDCSLVDQLSSPGKVLHY